MFQLTGKTIGPYRILEQIGVGGMAVVYKAYHPNTDRYVAIKVLPPHLSQDSEFVKRFQREARAIARLEHAHILPVHDYGEYEGVAYLVMRYVEAGTLKDRVTAGHFSFEDINHIIGQIGGALDYAHRMGVIHRDIKPGNVLVDDQGNTYLTDFGLARMMEPTQKLTASGVGLGTPAYMSPEQGQGDKVDHRSDIYSLGVILYEMVTGRVPYEAETPMAVVLKHINDELPLPRTIDSHVPESVERVILKALAKDPADRYQTAGEMVQALAVATHSMNAEPDVQPVSAPINTAPPREDMSLITRIQQNWSQPRGKVSLVGGGIVVIIALGFLLNWLLPTPVSIMGSGVTMTVATDVSSPNEPTLLPTTINTAVPEATAEPVEVPESVDLGEILTVCNGDICVCRGDNCSSTGLSKTYTNFDSSHLSWSPDGTSFVFTACTLEFVSSNPNTPCPTGTYVVRRDGTDAIRVSYDPKDTHRVPAWSPDDNWIAFSPSCNLSVVHPDGTGQRVLVPYNGLDCPWAIAWSPDGQRIAWIGGIGGAITTSAYVWVANSDGSDAKIVFYSPEVELVSPIAWNPSGDSVAVTLQNEKRYLIDTNCQGGAAGCDESSRMEISNIPKDWLHNFYPQWNSAVLYKEDFEDGKADGLVSIGAYWKVVSDEDGNQVYEVDTRSEPSGSTIEFGSYDWTDYAIEYRVKMLNPEADIWVNFRNSNQGRYIQRLSLKFDQVALYGSLGDSQWQPLTERDYNVEQGGWYQVRIEVQGDTIRIYVDGDLKIEKTDSMIGAGNVAIGNLGNAHALFDDIRVIRIGSTISKSELETILYEEDFEDGKADGLSYVYGDFQVVNDGTGNMVYEIDNTVNPVTQLGMEFGSSDWKDYAVEYRVRLLNPNASARLHFRSTAEGYHYTQTLSLANNVVSLSILPPEGSTQDFPSDFPVKQGVWYRVRVEARGETIRIYIDEQLIIERIVSEIDSGRVDLGIWGDTHAQFDDLRVVALDVSEQARAFAEPILSAISNRSPDFEDDFSDPKSGWYISNSESGESGYVDGEYYASALPGKGWGGFRDEHVYSDFVAEVDGHIISGTETSGWTFNFRSGSDSGDRYQIGIRSDGALWVTMSKSESDYQPYYTQGGSVRLGAGTNHLLLIVKDSYIALYINGEPLTLVQDETFASGTISLGVFSNDKNIGTRVHFDNFKIWDISDLP